MSRATGDVGRPDHQAPGPEPSLYTRIPNPESRIPNPESRAPNPESRVGIPLALAERMDPQVVSPESIGGLLRGILMDIRTLIREEVTLARLEIREQAGRARAAAISFGIAAVALSSSSLGDVHAGRGRAAAIADLLRILAKCRDFFIVAVLLAKTDRVVRLRHAFAGGRNTTSAADAACKPRCAGHAPQETLDLLTAEIRIGSRTRRRADPARR